MVVVASHISSCSPIFSFPFISILLFCCLLSYWTHPSPLSSNFPEYWRSKLVEHYKVDSTLKTASSLFISTFLSSSFGVFFFPIVIWTPFSLPSYFPSHPSSSNSSLNHLPLIFCFLNTIISCHWTCCCLFSIQNGHHPEITCLTVKHSNGNIEPFLSSLSFIFIVLLLHLISFFSFDLFTFSLYFSCHVFSSLWLCLLCPVLVVIHSPLLCFTHYFNFLSPLISSSPHILSLPSLLSVL